MGQLFSRSLAHTPPTPTAPPTISEGRLEEDDSGAGGIPRRPAGPPAAKRAAVATTDLSDRHIRLCAQDAILAVQKRVLGCAAALPTAPI
jgi:hypothetical protein